MDRKGMDFSANSAAEKHYRNIKPWLTCRVGLPDDWPRFGRRPKSAKAGRPSKTAPNSESGVKFNSIPALCFLPESQSIVTSEFASPKSPTCRVQILDKKGKLIHQFPTEVNHRDCSTFGVANARGDDEHVAVCTGDGVGIWNVEGKMVANMTNVNVQNCCHITRMQNGLLATTCITDMRGRSVTLWDPQSGKIASQFGSRPEIIDINPLKATRKFIIRNNDIRLPWFLTANSKNEIFISDRNAGCIKAFDTRNGKFLMRFDADGVDNRVRKTLCPQGICTDENDNILVADSVDYSLLVFDRHGEFVKVLATPRDGFDGEPWALAMTTEARFEAPICRSKCKGHDDARTLALSLAMPQPTVNIFKLSFCPHYTFYV